MVMSKIAEECLTNAGWFPGRKVDIEEYEEYLKEKGYELSSEIRRFLEEFGGLKVVHKHDKIENETDYFIIDPSLELGFSASGFNRKNCEMRTGEKLVPIGEANLGYMNLLMSYSGKIYIEIDTFLLKVGNDGYSAIGTFCENGEMEKIPF